MSTPSSTQSPRRAARSPISRRRQFIEKVQSKAKVRRTTQPTKRPTKKALSPAHNHNGPVPVTIAPQQANPVDMLSTLLGRNPISTPDAHGAVVAPQPPSSVDMLSTLLGHNPISTPGPPTTNPACLTSLLKKLGGTGTPGLPGLGPLAGPTAGGGLAALGPHEGLGVDPTMQALLSQLSAGVSNNSPAHPGEDPTILFTNSVCDLLNVVLDLRKAYKEQTHLESCLTQRAEAIKHANFESTSILTFRDRLKVARELTGKQLEVLDEFAKRAERFVGQMGAYAGTCRNAGSM